MTDARTSLVDVASRLLREGGPAAVTTRAVAAAAGVQAPTIYRQFGDKDGLLEAVAEHALATYVSTKQQASADADPVVDLRAGWDVHLDFGLANPAVFALLHDPARPVSPAIERGFAVLRERVRRVAAAGRLQVPESTAILMIRSAGDGAVLTLLSLPADERDPALVDLAWEALAGRILVDGDQGRPIHPDEATRSAAITLQASAPHVAVLSAGERVLLAEWLGRVVDA